MLFNSYEFLFAYLPVVLLGFFLIARKDRMLAAAWLVAASLFFYGWWNPKFVALLLASIVFNYVAGYWLGHCERRVSKAILVVSITANLSVLAVFKYANFFISTLNSVGAEATVIDLVLPAGISFFTFTQIAFLVDTYRGIAREYNFIHYALFVSWFPHLIAGPVLHHKQMMPQFSNLATYAPSRESFSVGLTLFSFGLFKKVMLADQFAEFGSPIFDGAAVGGHPMFVESWIGSLAYALQLYFDFSGYSDMAIGLSRMFNVKLPLNFDSPYKSRSVIEFWRRWHMTLSRFLRDYLYVPLGGNQKGTARRYVNLMVTMLLGGLWHGAGWGFVVWGGIHGAYLVLNHCWRWVAGRFGISGFRGAAAVSVLLTFLLVVIAWVPFRATSWTAALTVWRGMAGLNGISLPHAIAAIINSGLGRVGIEAAALTGLSYETYAATVWVIAGLAIVWGLPNSQQLLAKFSPAWETVAPARIGWSWHWAKGLIAGLMLGVSVLCMSRPSEFLYFQF